MGVHGLTTFIEGNRQFFKDVRFRDSRLVIDGSSLYFRLYFNQGLDQQHGGDYDALAALIGQFFAALSSCSIQPFVVLDGGMDHTDKKFSTLKQRAQSKIREAGGLSRGAQGSVLPLLTRQVFIQLLSALHVPFAQCVAEADWEIACLANQWSCPVLTADSDFYIFDLRGGYLPFGFFHWLTVSGKAGQRYVPARLFSVTQLCVRFAHMNKELLPLFAVMAGNDYTTQRAANAFSHLTFSETGRPRRSASHTRIEGLLHWLSGFPGPREALEEVLRLLGGGQRGSLRSLLLSGMQEYQLTSPSALACFFTEGALEMGLPAPLRGLPGWLLSGLIRGAVAPIVVDVLVLQKVLFFPQVEDCRLPSSHAACLPIRQTLYGLLLPRGGLRVAAQRGPGNQMDKGQQRAMSTDCSRAPSWVEEYDRHELSLRRCTVEPRLTALNHVPLDTLNTVPVRVRLLLLLETLGVEESALAPIPAHLRLPVAVTSFWMRDSRPRLASLQALLLGIVFGELSRMRANSTDLMASCGGVARVCDRLSRLRVPRGERRGLDLEAGHALSQWQSCLWMTLCLNGLLCHPLPEPQCAWLYSGTLVHRVVKELKGGASVEELLGGGVVAGQLYSSLLGAVQCSVGDHFSSVKKPTRRRRQQKGRGRGMGALPNQEVINRFALLMAEEEYNGE